MVMSDKVKGALIYILGTLSVATIVLLFSMLLSGCTTSAQARNGQIVGGVMLASGAATITAGQIVAHGANQRLANDCTTLSSPCRSGVKILNNGVYATYAGSLVAGAGFWTLLISSIQRPFLEHHEESHLRQAEFEIIDSSLDQN